MNSNKFKLRNIRERAFVLWCAGYPVPVIEVDGNSQFFARFYSEIRGRARIEMARDIPSHLRLEFIIHECIHMNAAILNKRKMIPKRIFDEATSLLSGFDHEGVLRAEYSSDKWPDEALVRLATDWRFRRANFRNIRTSLLMRLMLVRLTMPLSGIAHTLATAAAVALALAILS